MKWWCILTLICLAIPVFLIGGFLIYEYATTNFDSEKPCVEEVQDEEDEYCWFGDIARENFTTKVNDEILRYYLSTSQRGTLRLNRLSFDGRDIQIEDCLFRLYTRTANKNGVPIYMNNSLSLLSGGFDPYKPLIIATHGYLSTADETWMLQLARAQLSYLDSNFITLDWSYCSGSLIYGHAVDCVETVGKYLSDFLKFLQGLGVHFDNVHLMGHSLGAHLVGQVSRYGHKVYRISGFDPAGPGFSKGKLSERLDPEDAKIVDIIHTNTFMFGYKGELGHFDFYPNGGKKQPGCFIIDYICRHSMSYFYYIQSLYESYKYRGFKCSSVTNAWKGDCNGITNYMGVLADKGPPGVYHLKVDEPAKGEKCIDVH